MIYLPNHGPHPTLDRRGSLAHGLRLYVPFLEGGGRLVRNLADGSVGTLPGGSYSLAPFGRALETAGGTSEGAIMPLLWSGANDVTLSFWMLFPSAVANNACGWDQGNALNLSQRFCVQPWSDNNLYWCYGNTGGGVTTVPFSSYIGKWTHVVCVSTSDRNLFQGVYLNGNLAVSSGSSQGPTGSGTTFTIGRWLSTNGFNGRISHVGIWQRVLTPGEIRELYTGPDVLLARNAQFWIAEAPTPISGTSALTAAAATLAATGVVANPISATSDLVAAAATLAASGTVVNPISATSALTAAAATLAATGTITAPSTGGSNRLLLLGIG